MSTQLQPPTTPQPRRGRIRLRIAAFAAAGTLALATPLAAGAAVSHAADVAQSATTWSDAGPGSGTGQGYGSGQAYGSAQGGSSSTVDSQAATAAESSGVALIDTELASGGEGAGTGMVLTSSGEVLTNYHVVEGAEQISVTLADTGRSYTATVLGSDESADVALLQLKGASGLSTVRIDDDDLAVGDEVTAVGNAGGTGTLTAADGTVTSLSATITTSAEGTAASETLHKLIETSADVVAGDSGGPLLDSEGEVVGIDTAASTGGDIDGYAIAIDTALTVVQQIRSGEESSTVQIGAAAYLGVQISDGGSGFSSGGYSSGGYSGGDYSGGSSSTDGATVVGVEDGSAAQSAGLEAGDTITAIGGTTVGSADDVTEAIRGHQPGDRVIVHWTDADGTAHRATVTLGSSPIA